MKIIEKIVAKSNDIHGVRQPVIAVLGDSISQGCFECYDEKGNVGVVFEPESGYVAKLRIILEDMFPMSAVQVINAGISGGRAEFGLSRLERDVLSYNPDLVIVCFGLNDCNAGPSGLNTYLNSLKGIFEGIREKSDAEIIFMTPNMCCDKLDNSFKDQSLIDAANKVVNSVKNGWVKTYFDEAKKLCGQMDVPVCDCYKIWEDLNRQGVDVNSLLSNKINHPTRPMHDVFAYELLKTMIG